MLGSDRPQEHPFRASVYSFVRPAKQLDVHSAGLLLSDKAPGCQLIAQLCLTEP